MGKSQVFQICPSWKCGIFAT